MSTVLYIGDTHAPFMHPNYIRFLTETAEKYSVNEYVHIGDAVDSHVFSRFMRHPEALSTIDEWRKAKKQLRELDKLAGGKMKWVCGNHDVRPLRRTRDAGIPDGFVHRLEEIYGVPEWELSDSFVIDGVLSGHGERAGGLTGWQGFPLKMGQSVVFGHYHSVGGIRWHRTKNGQCFALATSCGINEESYAFEYAKFDPGRPVLGCGIVKDGTEAHYINMDMDLRRNYRIRKAW